MIKPQKFTSRLASIEKVSSKVYVKRFDLIEPKEIAFLAGQTVMLQVAPGVNRSMSIASPPSIHTSILVAHDVSPNGPYSQWTVHASVGDSMNFIGPLGVFVCDAQSPRRKIFVATGTGIAPFRSMVLDQLSVLRSQKNLDPSSVSLPTNHSRYGNEKVKPDKIFSLPAPIILYWGLRHEKDVFWEKEFEDLATKHSNFQFVLTLSQPALTRRGRPSESWPASNALRSNAGWQGKRGRVGEHVFAMEQNLMGSDFYLCGNKPMVTEMEAALLAKGVPKEQIKRELFY